MKKFILYKALSLTLIGLLFSCSNDDNSSVITPNENVPTAQEFNELRENVLNQMVQTANFNAEDGLSFTSEAGCVLDIPANCLLMDGNSVSGNVELRYVEIFDAGNMLLTDRPTMGMMDNGDLALLESGGEFRIEVFKDGEPVQLNCSMNLEVPGDLTNGPVTDMTLWEGRIDEDGDLAWDEIDPEAGGMNEGVFVDGSSYFCLIGDFGWTNVDRFYNDPRPKTTLLVDVPDGYDDKNAEVYLLYDDQPHALARLDVYDPETGYFSEHYGQVPIGLECHVIFVSGGEGTWIYAVKDETIEEDEIITFTSSELNEITEEALFDLIGNL